MMGEEFHAIIKLVSGEEIFALVSVDDEESENPILILQNPLTIKYVNTPNGGFVKVKSWIELIEEDFFMIRLDKVITMSETKEQRLIDIYNHFLTDDATEIYHPDGSVRPDSKMGYVTSVKDARKTLEALFKLKNKES